MSNWCTRYSSCVAYGAPEPGSAKVSTFDPPPRKHGFEWWRFQSFWKENGPEQFANQRFFRRRREVPVLSRPVTPVPPVAGGVVATGVRVFGPFFELRHQAAQIVERDDARHEVVSGFTDPLGQQILADIRAVVRVSDTGTKGNVDRLKLPLQVQWQARAP